MLLFVLVSSDTFVSVVSPSPETVQFELSGGSLQSYGCKPIDPSYWISGSGSVVTIIYREKQNQPTFRVWGMNTDDAAGISVNGSDYPLSISTASYTTKITCGTSPGTEGITFQEGLLVGVNTPSQGNYSYQDITLNAINVKTLTIRGLRGAGWGFCGIVQRGPRETEDATKHQRRGRIDD